MKTLTLPDGSNLSVPVPRNKGVEELYAQQRIERLPIHRKLDARQFAICAITEANKLPADTSPGSIVIAVVNAACVGVLLGQHPGHAFLVAYRNRKTGKRDCQLIMGYKGFLDLGYDANFLESVSTNVVLRGEEFRHYVDDRPRVEHTLPIDREEVWENVVGAYCLWTPKGAPYPVPEVIGRKELETLYRNASSRGQSPWQTGTIGMCRKTPIRRAAKLWKQTRELSWAIGLDEAADRGETQDYVNPALEPQEDDSAPPLTTEAWSTNPHQAAGDAAQEEVAAGANGMADQSEQPVVATWNQYAAAQSEQPVAATREQYAAALADASSIRQVAAIADDFLKQSLPGADTDRTIAMAEKRKAEIRASRGGREELPKHCRKK